MEGYLDYLESTRSRGLHKLFWVRRFFKLNVAYQVLEIYADETQFERKRKIELRGACVSTADELGGLLHDDKTVAEMSRRFIFRITAPDKKHYYLCSDLSSNKLPVLTSYEIATFARTYLEKWLNALRRTIAAENDTSISAATMGLDTLTAQIAAFMNHMHLSARISNRFRDHRQSINEITVKSWILKRELVNEDEDQDGYSNVSRANSDVSWQISEYACSWKIMKSTGELQNFDEQLRQFIGSGMQNLIFPSQSIGSKFQHFYLHASTTHKEAEKTQHIQIYDMYLQSLLLLPEFSSFGSDASKMFDTFFDISPHFASFRKLEKKIGLSMHLRDRKVVPWKDRERFDVVYEMHLQSIAAHEENARRVVLDRTISRSKKHTTSQRHNGSRHRYPEKSNDIGFTQAGDHNLTIVEIGTAPLPAPIKLHVAAEARRDEDRMAQIGRRLVMEAFET